ncbi:MAG: sigma-70 family RNA polymerase sigma factor [Verrucomicrobiales bacterium]|nr:sigma-70 family RNA polymerase sigma factor [Verrucomicrobiales bacterium]
MQEISETGLLERFVQEADDAAFGELVRRHCNLVWATAWRVTGDSEASRDITQTVFALLARKASRLPSRVVVAGWLYRAARLEATQHLRRESRRSRRERVAMNALESDSASLDAPRALDALQPLLDEALAELPDADRDAIVMRYLSGRSLAEIGSALGSNEDAAQKRVGRALERLRGWFRKRGVTVGEGVVAAALGHAAAQAAPAGLAAAVAATVVGGAGGMGSAAVVGFGFMNAKLGMGTLAVLATAGLVWQQRRVGRLELENQDLRARMLVPPPPAALVAPPSVSSRADEEHAELLRLRGEVARLRPQSAPGQGADPDARVRQAEARTEALREEVLFRNRRAQLIESGKALAMAVHVYANQHPDRAPTSWKELNESFREMGLTEEDRVPPELSGEVYEFLPLTQVPDPSGTTIWFREREPRRIPEAVLREEDLKPGTPFAMPLRRGWERNYVMSNGAVQTLASADGDFTELEKQLSSPRPAAGPLDGRRP